MKQPGWHFLSWSLWPLDQQTAMSFRKKLLAGEMPTTVIGDSSKIVQPIWRMMRDCAMISVKKGMMELALYVGKTVHLALQIMVRSVKSWNQETVLQTWLATGGTCVPKILIGVVLVAYRHAPMMKNKMVFSVEHRALTDSMDLGQSV